MFSAFTARKMKTVLDTKAKSRLSLLISVRRATAGHTSWDRFSAGNKVNDYEANALYYCISWLPLVT
jgi:hypothetical protein